MTFEVGDEVYIKSGTLPHKVLYIHHTDPERKWYVIAYMGDIPKAYRESELTKVPPVKRVSFQVNGIPYTVDCIKGIPQWGTVK